MDSPPPRSSTKEMGDKFSEIYYRHLRHHPENLCKFYKEQSTISRPGLDGEKRTSTLSWWLRVEPFALKNLPQDATIAFVEAAFQHFGEIRRGGIEVRNKKGFSYGFLEFKEASAAEKAIEASPLKLAVGGGNVYVEKKRPDYISYWETPPSYGPGTKSRSEAMTGEVDDKLGNLLKPSGAAYDSASMKLHAKNHGGANNHHESNNCSTRTQLFQKELTPSDVGKLNRLVIPKKHAVKYMPFISDEQGEKEGVEDVEVVFYDRAMRQWKFRYCYWRSSQSFVFTRGWNGFVKEKNLKANDIIVFYTCNDPGESKNYLMIDVQGSTSDEVPEEVNQTVQDNTSDEEVITQNPLSPELEDKETKSEENNKGGFKLFGVMIQQ